jgi:uncharacterized protein (DUF433 family)
MAQTIVSNPEILSGEPVFRGTRVLLRILLIISSGHTLDEFLDDFPGVSRQAAIVALKELV